jgi:hypothetical protein
VFFDDFIGVIPLTEDKMVPVSCKGNGYDKEFEYNFDLITLKFIQPLY